MFDNLLKDYYKTKIGVSEICKTANITHNQFYKELRKRNMKSVSGYYASINTGDEELNIRLRRKYNNIANRCKGLGSHKGNTHDGLDYITINEWVDFCNTHKEKLVKMWKKYKDSECDARLLPSIDRIDNNAGYCPENMEFVPYGYNAWRRNVKPVKVTKDGVTNYFLFSEEASKHYGLRRQTIGDLLRGVYRIAGEGFTVEPSDVETVLAKRGYTSLEQYYHDHIILV